MTTIGNIEVLTVLRYKLTGTTEMSEGQIRSLCGELGADRFLRELFENNLIHFKQHLPGYMRGEHEISIEIPSLAEYYTTGRKCEGGGPVREWMDTAQMKDHTIKAIFALQTAIDEYNKILTYVKISRETEKE